MTTNTAQAQPYHNDDGKDYDNNYYKSEKDNSKRSVISINKIKCINDNININGVNSGDVNIGNKKGQGYLDANPYGGYYDGYGKNKQGKGFDDCIINNNNNNTNINLGGGNQTEPTTATLTVKKQVFGCDNISSPGGTVLTMNCLLLQNNSPDWLDCNTNPTISDTIFCQSLPESIFDIEVLDDQNTLIQEFIGSEQGTTIQNLQPGTYTVNEIEHLSGNDQLTEYPFTEQACISAGFTDGGELINSTASIGYSICFEYEDEQGNDCSTITLAVGEERTCTVQNYIRAALDL